MDTKFIDVVDRYGRRQLINISEIKNIVDYGSYRRVFFKASSQAYLTQSFEELKEIIRRNTGQIKKL